MEHHVVAECRLQGLASWVRPVLPGRACIPGHMKLFGFHLFTCKVLGEGGGEAVKLKDTCSLEGKL